MPPVLCAWKWIGTSTAFFSARTVRKVSTGFFMPAMSSRWMAAAPMSTKRFATSQ